MVLRAILVLSIVGLALSGYLTYLHFAPEKFDSSFCNINDFFSCSTVNKSSYATFLGVPVGLIGVAGFLLLGFLSLGRVPYSREGVFYFSLIGVGFMTYLTGAELFIIEAVCILCVGTAATITAIFGVSTWAFGRESIQFAREIKFE